MSIQDQTPETGETAIAESAMAVAESATEQREIAAVLYDPDLDFQRLALDVAYRAQGFRLVQKEDLAGVPFVVKRIVYRPGYPRGGAEGDYVSVECVVANQEILDSAPIKAQVARSFPQGLTVFANEPVIFNDSGTGIRRELTSLLEKFSIANLGKTRDDENPADRQFQLWASGAEDAQAGITGEHFGGQAAIYLALRGLRRSDYESPYGPATTWYFG